jgi:hypothetical protein
MSTDLSPISAGSIRSIISNAGLTLSPLGDVVVVDDLQASLRLDQEKGGIVLIGADGTASPVDLLKHLAELAKAKPDFFRPAEKSGTPASSGTTSTNLTERMKAILATRETPVSRAKKAASQKIDGNPWISGNLTHQMVIQKHDPARAAKLKAEATQK